MEITHAKVSGLTNPADPDLVGGEDWDDLHVIKGPALVGFAGMTLTTAGAILSQVSGNFSFSKQATGTYRATYSAGAWGGGTPVVMATISTASGAARSTRVALGNNGTSDYIDVTTTDAAGTATDLASGTLNVAVYANVV